MVEKVEVVGYRIRWAYPSYRSMPHIGADNCHPDDGTSEPLMTVAQHERIVAGYDEAARELDKWLIPLLSGKLHGVDHGPYLKWRAAIDAFLAQTAEGE